MSESDTDDPPDRTAAADDAADQLEPSRANKRYAYAYVTVLLTLPVVAVAAAVWLGWLAVDVQVAATVDASWILEYLLLGIVALFLLFTAAMVSRIIGIGFVRGLVQAAARIADAYELPHDDREQ